MVNENFITAGEVLRGMAKAYQGVKLSGVRNRMGTKNGCGSGESQL